MVGSTSGPSTHSGTVRNGAPAASMCAVRPLSSSTRSRLTAVVVVAVLVGGPGLAHADPAEPTDYLSEMVSESPSTDALEVRIIGGDAFVQVEVAPGHELAVAGYQGEPFLRVLDDGRVEENHRSPSWALSQERFPSGELPDDVGADLAPMWVEVSEGGTWVWHDHRAHWMGREPPMGLGPGDQVAEGVIPMTVDGRAVEVRVVSTWIPAPSQWPAVLGLIVGLVCVVGLFLACRADGIAMVAAVASVAALAIGAWQYQSLPAAAGPQSTSWSLPAAACVAMLVAAIAGRRAQHPALVLVGATALAAVELSVWAWLRRSVLTRAVLPTSAPWWLDRATTAFVAVVALAVLVWVVRSVSVLATAQAQPSASM